MCNPRGGGGGGTPYNGLYGKALPKRDTFLREFMYVKGHGFHKLKLMKGFGKSVIADCTRTDRRSSWLQKE